MRLVELDLTGQKNEQEICDFLREQLHLSDFQKDRKTDPVMLFEALINLEENICVRVISCKEQTSQIYEYGKILESVMENAAQTVQCTEDGNIYVFAGFEPLERGGLW